MHVNASNKTNNISVWDKFSAMKRTTPWTRQNLERLNLPFFFSITILE